MQLREFLHVVGSGYNAADGFDTTAQALLKDAGRHLQGYGPFDFMIRASGGQKPLGATHTPWIGFFDPDETTSPQQGLYVVWILQADRASWTLSINRGTEQLPGEIKRADAERGVSGRQLSVERRVRERLVREADLMRQELKPITPPAWLPKIDLHSQGTRQLRYEAAAVLGRAFSVVDLPNDQHLSEVLDEACVLLQEAAKTRDHLAATMPGSISTARPEPRRRAAQDPAFEPGIDRDKTIELPARTMQVTPRHEGGLASYGRWLEAHGQAASTKCYPCDFVILGSKPEWLGEYKVVYGNGVIQATREAFSQLKEYRHFEKSPIKDPSLVAVFSSPIPLDRVAWLNAEGIAVVWADGRSWVGCDLARAGGLAPGSEASERWRP